MPKFHEVFGIKASSLHPDGLAGIRTAGCPFTQSRCDGGGNRHQTRITLAPDHECRGMFDTALASLVPAVCSIDYGPDQWVVCPRRLMGFRNEQATIPPANLSLQEHERNVLREAGLQPGVEYGIWSEVYLNYAIDDTEIDYHFDFIVAPLMRDVPFGQLAAAYAMTEAEQAWAAKCAKAGSHMAGRRTPASVVRAVPDLSHPIIIEVMTASTSGSNTAAGTNISAAFRDLMLGRDYQGPGINKRQVWGRMATQLFAKSALAEGWGGKTYWLVQDRLLHNIERTTKLRTSDTTDDQQGTIHFIALKYANGDTALELDKVARLKAGIAFDGSGTCADILLPKAFPPKIWLLQSMLRRNVAAVVKL